MLEAIQNGDDWGDLSLPYGLVVSCHYLTQWLFKPIEKLKSAHVEGD
jgi:hypothetical protein